MCRKCSHHRTCSLVNKGHAHAPHHHLFLQGELEKVVCRSKTEREQVMASLLLAELFNKWGASSPGYTIDIMERGSVARCAPTVVTC
jgi:hypothetical protein